MENCYMELKKRKSAPAKKRNYSTMHSCTAAQLKPKAIFFGILCFPLDLIAVKSAFGFGENPTELYRGGADLPRLEKKGCQMYDKYFIMILFHSHKQKLAEPKLIGLSLCYSVFFLIRLF